MGSLSFYLLLRELGRDRSVSTLATLALCSSPLVLMLTFTFMSDIQFLGWLLVSLWLTVRGICRSSPAIMLAGSLAAGCAIGTRQFGVAVIVGLFVSSMTSGKEISLRSRLLLPAVAVPVLAAGAQLYMGLRGQNFTQFIEFGRFTSSGASQRQH